MWTTVRVLANPQFGKLVSFSNHASALQSPVHGAYLLSCCFEVSNSTAESCLSLLLLSCVVRSKSQQVLHGVDHGLGKQFSLCRSFTLQVSTCGADSVHHPGQDSFMFKEMAVLGQVRTPPSHHSVLRRTAAEC
eukprot:3795614-Rhodomonas_salina.1